MVRRVEAVEYAGLTRHATAMDKVGSLAFPLESKAGVLKYTDPILYAAGGGKKKAGTAASPTPTAPTIDEATQNRDEYDRIRRRRGVLATLFGGVASGSAPTVATKQLLGA